MFYNTETYIILKCYINTTLTSLNRHEILKNVDFLQFSFHFTASSQVILNCERTFLKKYKVLFFRTGDLKISFSEISDIFFQNKYKKFFSRKKIEVGVGKYIYFILFFMLGLKSGTGSPKICYSQFEVSHSSFANVFISFVSK